ncbi:MAG: hypothetical protein M5U26_05665 [Planctomycetota bacterium]|nr:hypothetical protein [Planctomycetota bacterium]
MAKRVLGALPRRVLKLLLEEGGQGVAALFGRAREAWALEPDAFLAAVQDLYDLSMIDVKAAGADAYRDDLSPEELRRAYRHLDAFTAEVSAARGGDADPFALSVSHLGLAERFRPESEDDAEPPPAAARPTLPFE